MSYRIENQDNMLTELKKLTDSFHEKSKGHDNNVITLDTTHKTAIEFLALHHTAEEIHAIFLTALFNTGHTAEEIIEYITQTESSETKSFLCKVFDDYFAASQRFSAYQRLSDMLEVLNKYPLKELPQ